MQGYHPQELHIRKSHLNFFPDAKFTGYGIVEEQSKSYLIDFMELCCNKVDPKILFETY